MANEMKETEISVPVSYREPPMVIDIESSSIQNSNFRQVLHTDGNMQLVLMSLRPLQDIGLEMHPLTTQFIRCERGTGLIQLGTNMHWFTDGFAAIIPAGTWHNVLNISTQQPLSLYTLYCPPHHKPGTIVDL